MYLSEKDRAKTLKLIETFSKTLDSTLMREQAGFALLDLLKADQFASFVWNDKSQCFEKGVFINLSENNINHYHAYYAKNDPITYELGQKRSATLVNQIMPQQALVKTEFYNDFLAVDGLHYGINLHAYQGDQNIGDLRIWRGKGKNNFDEKSAYILDLIKPYFCNAMNNIAQYEKLSDMISKKQNNTARIDANALIKTFLLTKREAQITLEIIEGYKDEQIAVKLHIAFSTLRTHIKHIFNKVNVNSRQLLIRKVLGLCEH